MFITSRKKSPIPTASTPSASSGRRKSPLPGRQDQVKSRMLEMAEKEHEQKMKILQLKEEVLILKKQKLEKQLGNNVCNTVEIDSNNNSCGFWQPYAS